MHAARNPTKIRCICKKQLPLKSTPSPSFELRDALNDLCSCPHHRDLSGTAKSLTCSCSSLAAARLASMRRRTGARTASLSRWSLSATSARFRCMNSSTCRRSTKVLTDRPQAVHCCKSQDLYITVFLFHACHRHDKLRGHSYRASHYYRATQLQLGSLRLALVCWSGLEAL